MKSLAVSFISYFFILLFVYAAVSKMRGFADFQIELAQSPVLSAYAGPISVGVLILEVATALLLVFDKTRRIGLYASFGLMTAFTVYIYLILNFADDIPCSCGGILEKMNWEQHMMFNIVCVFLALTGIVFTGKERARGWSRTAAFTTLTAVFSGGSIVALFLSSEYIMKKENSFIRRFPQHPVIKEKSYDLEVNSYYLAGWGAGKLYLGNTTAPTLLTALNEELNAQSTMYAKLPTDTLLFSAPRIQVVYPVYYFYDGRVPVIYEGKLGVPQMRTLSYRNAYFNQLTPLSDSAFAVRTIVPQPKHFALGRINTAASPAFTLAHGALSKKVRSLFETDGSLISDRQTGEIIYVYAYLNRFFVMDSRLENKKEFNTIDTTRAAPLRVSVLQNGEKQLVGVPGKINKKSAAFRGVLFIESGSMGRYESLKTWKETATVDMYATARQEYLGSFRLYLGNREKVTDFLLTDRYLFVITGSLLTRYRLTKNITKHFRTGEAENLKQE